LCAAEWWFLWLPLPAGWRAVDGWLLDYWPGGAAGISCAGRAAARVRGWRRVLLDPSVSCIMHGLLVCWVAGCWRLDD
jgi:hypothetical protein